MATMALTHFTDLLIDIPPTSRGSNHFNDLCTLLTPSPNPMDLNLYKALKNGEVEYLDQHSDLFDNQVTPNHNTILHVAALFGKSECVAKILEKKPGHLILQVNLNRENPLHIAVREQHFDVVQKLINGAEELDRDLESGGGTLLQMLMATNVDGDTPLHLAVREGDNEFVILLVNKFKAFQHPPYMHIACQRPNKAGETPLFLAAERKNGASMVDSILASESPDYRGPIGRTALHAAAISGNIGRPVNEQPSSGSGLDNRKIGTDLLTSIGYLSESIKKLLYHNTELIYKADEQGWTPLHYAAYCGNKNTVRELLQENKSVGYIRTTEMHDNSIALHIAVAAGNEDVMEEILSHCPDCWEMVNSKGQNILHIAMDKEAECVIDYIILRDELKSLINQKDCKGNTPLHLLASSNMKDMDDIINHPKANMYAVNNQNKTPAEVAMSVKENNRSPWLSKARGWRNIGSNEEQKAKMTEDFLVEREWKESKEVKAENRTSQSYMLVATLIATITFAAGFAISAGYEAKQGLVQEVGIKACVLANTIAVMCSTSSVLFYVFAALYDDDDGGKAECNVNGFFLLLIAVVAMALGFLLGTYAMLAHFLGLTIATSVIAGIFFLIYFRQLIRLYLYIKFQEFVAKVNKNARNTSTTASHHQENYQ